MSFQKPLWSELQQAGDAVAPIRTLFDADPKRLGKHTIEAAGLVLDASKNRVDDATAVKLFALARSADVEARRDAMYAGEKINVTEQRAVLHVALRAPRGASFSVDGKDVMADVHAVLDHMEAFSEQVRSGSWKGHDGRAITDVVHIGIGGSDLGPRFAEAALASYRHERVAVHFVANVDAHAIVDTLAPLDAATTLFIIASKTFTTAETMMNARTARDWSLAGGVPERELHRHFVAVSTNARDVARSASTRRTCSASGTGSAAAIRCGRPSGCRSRCRAAWRAFANCWPARPRWTRTSSKHRSNTTCRCGSR